MPDNPNFLADVDDVVTAAQLQATVDAMSQWQLGSGMVPWFPGGHADPWNHTEALMALMLGGRREAAELGFEWLQKTQHDDGSWKPTAFAHQELWASGRQPDFNCTAYMAWALARAGEKTDKARAWLTTRAAEVESPYSLALAALAHLSADSESAQGREIVGRLAELGTADAKGLRWQVDHPTGLGARGRTARIETSALAVQALLLEGRSPALAEDGLRGLIQWRGKDGRFGTTQSTILALQALLNAESGDGGGEPTHIRVTRGETVLSSQRLEANRADVLRLDLGTGGLDGLQVEVAGSRRIRATLSRTYHVPWSENPATTGRLDLAVSYPTETLAVGVPALATITIRNKDKVTARLVTAEIGVPPGCTIDRKLLRGKGYERVERSKHGLVLYLLDLEPGEARTFKLPFVPRHGLDVHTTPSRAYEYYVPHEATVLAPARVRAR